MTWHDLTPPPTASFHPATLFQGVLECAGFTSPQSLCSECLLPQIATPLEFQCFSALSQCGLPWPTPNSLHSSRSCHFSCFISLPYYLPVPYILHMDKDFCIFPSTAIPPGSNTMPGTKWRLINCGTMLISRENSNLKIYTHPSVYSSTVYNSWDTEAT